MAGMLPPVKTRPGQAAGADGGGQDFGGPPAANAQHPFDAPFGMMQAMQAELLKLREELRSEQTERRSEAAALRKEISLLGESLRRVEAKGQVDHDRLAAALRDVRTKEESDWTSTNALLRAELAKRTFVDDHQQLCQRVDGCQQQIGKTQAKFEGIFSDVQKQLQANSDGDNDFAQEMKKELEGARAELDRNRANDQVFEDTVVVQLRMAGQLLQSAGLHKRVHDPAPMAGEGGCCGAPQGKQGDMSPCGYPQAARA